jgi:hypothetical protein
VSGVVVRVCACTTLGRTTTAAAEKTVVTIFVKSDRRLVVPVLVVEVERGRINCSFVGAASSAVVIEGSEKFFTDYCDALFKAC